MVLAIIDGIFTISAGTITALLWIIVIVKRIDHKFVENPTERLFHIIAEFLMSIVAIIAGIALLLELTWAIPMFYLAMGLIIYAAVNAVGIYKEKNNLLALVLIGTAVITLALTIISIFLLS